MPICSATSRCRTSEQVCSKLWSTRSPILDIRLASPPSWDLGQFAIPQHKYPTVQARCNVSGPIGVLPRQARRDYGFLEKLLAAIRPEFRQDVLAFGSARDL